MKLRSGVLTTCLKRVSAHTKNVCYKGISFWKSAKARGRKNTWEIGKSVLFNKV